MNTEKKVEKFTRKLRERYKPVHVLGSYCDGTSLYWLFQTPFDIVFTVEKESTLELLHESSTLKMRDGTEKLQRNDLTILFHLGISYLNQLELNDNERAYDCFREYVLLKREIMKDEFDLVKVVHILRKLEMVFPFLFSIFTKIALNLGYIAESAEIYELEAKETPMKNDRLYNKGFAALIRNEYTEARKLFEKSGKKTRNPEDQLPPCISGRLQVLINLCDGMQCWKDGKVSLAKNKFFKMTYAYDPNYYRGVRSFLIKTVENSEYIPFDSVVMCVGVSDIETGSVFGEEYEEEHTEIEKLEYAIFQSPPSGIKVIKEEGTEEGIQKKYLEKKDDYDIFIYEETVYKKTISGKKINMSIVRLDKNILNLLILFLMNKDDRIPYGKLYHKAWEGNRANHDEDARLPRDVRAMNGLKTAVATLRRKFNPIRIPHASAGGYICEGDFKFCVVLKKTTGQRYTLEGV
ncbi:hypothetical protein KAR91_84625 [Candidatus Pacearchaeota archaeon]|nr:hypothetical protein [Candidatus Pacearchaeota archaeon]